MVKYAVFKKVMGSKGGQFGRWDNQVFTDKKIANIYAQDLEHQYTGTWRKHTKWWVVKAI